MSSEQGGKTGMYRRGLVYIDVLAPFRVGGHPSIALQQRFTWNIAKNRSSWGAWRPFRPEAQWSKSPVGLPHSDSRPLSHGSHVLHSFENLSLATDACRATLSVWGVPSCRAIYPRSRVCCPAPCYRRTAFPLVLERCIL